MSVETNPHNYTNMNFIFSQFAVAKNPVRPRKNTAEGGCGGNSAVFLQKIEASPVALLVESRTQQKSFLFLLEEKIRRAQIRKSEKNFFAGLRVVASGGGLASLVGVLRKMGSDFFKQTPPLRSLLCRSYAVQAQSRYIL